MDEQPTWVVEGKSEDGSPGEDCSFYIGIRNDGTGWIVGDAEYAADLMGLSLSREQLRDLRDMLSAALGKEGE